MKRLLIIILIALYSNINAQQNQLQQEAYKDSSLIYECYKQNIPILQSMSDKEEDYHKWYKLVDSLSNLLACAFNNLRVYNKESYKPIDELNKEGFGVAYLYPKPSGNFDTITRYKFTTIDIQTKFIVRNNGSTIIPYVERRYYGYDFKLLYIKKLDPVTLEEI